MTLAVCVDPSDIGYDVIVLAGQSNMVGAGSQGGGGGAPDAFLDPSDPRIHRWVHPSNTSTSPSLAAYRGMISLAADPLGHPDVLNDVGPGMAIARRHLLTLPGNRRILLVPTAVQGTALVGGPWNCVTGILFAGSVAQANAAIAAAGPNARVAAICWLQGESDSGQTAGAYQAALDALIAAYRAQITGATVDTPFVIGAMTASARPAQINVVHADTPNRVPHTAFVDIPAGYGSGHYTNSGYRLIGAAMGAAIGAARENVPTPSVPGQVTGLSVVPGNRVAAVSWLPVAAYVPVSSYVVECRPSGGTWVSVANGADTTAMLPGLVGGVSYDFRVSAVNSVGTGLASATVSATPADSESLLGQPGMASAAVTAAAGIVVGTAITASVAGQITALHVGVRRGAGGAQDTGDAWGKPFTAGVYASPSSSSPVVAVSGTTQSADGWQRVPLPAPVSVAAGQTFVAAVIVNGAFVIAQIGPTWPVGNGQHLSAVAGGSLFAGSSGTTLALPANNAPQNRFAIDVEFVLTWP